MTLNLFFIFIHFFFIFTFPLYFFSLYFSSNFLRTKHSLYVFFEGVHGKFLSFFFFLLGFWSTTTRSCWCGLKSSFIQTRHYWGKHSSLICITGTNSLILGVWAPYFKGRKFIEILFCLNSKWRLSLLFYF